MKAERDFDAALIGIIEWAVHTARNMSHAGNSVEAYKLLTDICRLPEVLRRDEGCTEYLAAFVEVAAPRYRSGEWAGSDFGHAIERFMEAYRAYGRVCWQAEQQARKESGRPEKNRRPLTAI